MTRAFSWLLTLAVVIPLAAAEQRTYLTSTHGITVAPGQDASALIRPAQRTLDTAGQAVVVTFLPGEHAHVHIAGRFVGDGPLYLTGTGATVNGIAAVTDAVVDISQLRLVNPAGAGIAAVFGARVQVGAGVEFGPVSGEHIMASYNSIVNVVASYTVTGGGSSHLHAYGSGTIIVNHDVVTTFVGTPTFQHYVIGVATSSVGWLGTFTGAVNGQSCVVHSTGSLFSYGRALPGNGVCGPQGPDSTVW